MTNQVIYSKKKADAPLIVVAVTDPESLNRSISKAVSRAVSENISATILLQ